LDGEVGNRRSLGAVETGVRIGMVVRLAGLCAVSLAANLILVGAEATRTAPTAPPTVPLCQRPFARGEWGTDVLIDVTVSRPPAVGQTAMLIVEVCAKRAGPVQLDIELPASFVWVVLPAGFASQDRVSHNPVNFGCLHAAHGTAVLGSFEPLRLTATVQAGTPGPAILTATARLESGPVGSFDTSYADLTVGRTPRSSHFGFPNRNTSESRSTAAPPPIPSC
jgi:hypothetical protein